MQKVDLNDVNISIENKSPHKPQLKYNNQENTVKSKKCDVKENIMIFLKVVFSLIDIITDYNLTY